MPGDRIIRVPDSGKGITAGRDLPLPLPRPFDGAFALDPVNDDRNEPRCVSVRLPAATGSPTLCCVAMPAGPGTHPAARRQRDARSGALRESARNLADQPRGGGNV